MVQVCGPWFEDQAPVDDIVAVHNFKNVYIHPSFCLFKNIYWILHCLGIYMTKTYSLPSRCLQFTRKINDQHKANVQFEKMSKVKIQLLRKSQICFENLSKQGWWGGNACIMKGLSQKELWGLIYHESFGELLHPIRTDRPVVPWTAFSTNTFNFVTLFYFFPQNTVIFIFVSASPSIVSSSNRYLCGRSILSAPVVDSGLMVI